MLQKISNKHLASFIKWVFIFAVVHIVLFFLQKDSFAKIENISLMKIYLASLMQFEMVALLCVFTGYSVSMYFQDRPYWYMFLLITPYLLLASIAGLLINALLNILIFPDKLTVSDSIAAIPMQIPPTLVITIVLSLIFSRIGYLEYQVKLGEKTGAENIIPLPATTDKKEEGLSFKEGENYYIIPYVEIIYISAHNKNSVIHTTNKDYKTARLLKEIESKLSPEQFFRIHKSFIVNLSLISHIQYFMGGSYLAFLKDEDETNLPVGRSYAPLLKARLNI